MITSEFFFKRFSNRSSRKNNCSEVEKLDDFENKTFEHHKKSDVTEQKGDLLPLRPIWLPRLDDTRIKGWLKEYLF